MEAPFSATAALSQLLAAVELQLEAARTSNAAALLAATETRRTLQDGLHAGMFGEAEDLRREEIVRLARRIQALDARIRACGESVLGAIASMAPECAPATYSRRGMMRSAP